MTAATYDGSTLPSDRLAPAIDRAAGGPLMRRLALVPAFVIAFLVAACSSGSASPAASSGGAASPAGGAASPAGGAASPAGGAASAEASSGASTAASGGTTSGAACAAAPAGATAVVTVTIKDFKFSPQPVQAKVGDVIVWSNQDSAPHSATLDDGTCDTRAISSGAQAGLVFSAPGTYTYHCAIHPTQMKGYTIEVK